MVACINLQDKSTIEYFLKNEKQVTENFGLCPNVTEKTNWKIGGKLNDPPTLIIQIRYYPCSLADPSLCATPAEMQQFEFKFGIIKKGFNPSNFKTPVQNIPSFDKIVHFNPAQEKRYDIDFQKTEIWDDYRDLSKDELKESFFSIYGERIDNKQRFQAQVYCTKEQIMN